MLRARSVLSARSLPRVASFVSSTRQFSSTVGVKAASESNERPQFQLAMGPTQRYSNYDAGTFGKTTFSEVFDDADMTL
ncbi:hypothetical protein JNB11_01960 [Kocuria palustris]|nr:hypothetical protein [Kocuria palustris]